MWSAATVSAVPASEPLSLAQSRIQCRIESSDTDFDTELNGLITAARSYVEVYTGLALVTQTIIRKCDTWSDFERLPDAPVASLSSISYVDGEGDDQTLSTDVYELRAEGLEGKISLNNSYSWPSIQANSRITVTYVAGYSQVPEAIEQALLFLVGDMFDRKESFVIEGRTIVDDLLVNFRI